MSHAEGRAPRPDSAEETTGVEPTPVATPDPAADPAEEIEEKGEPSDGNFA